jgi:uncharacterized protein (DUF433 family)
MNTDMLIRTGEGELYIGDSRVLLRTLVAARARGQAPEDLQQSFPSLSLAQIHGAIVYYLEHQAELDARFAEDRRDLDAMDAANRAAHADFFDAMHARIEATRARRDARPSMAGEASEA